MMWFVGLLAFTLGATFLMGRRSAEQRELDSMDELNRCEYHHVYPVSDLSMYRNSRSHGQGRRVTAAFFRFRREAAHGERIEHMMIPQRRMWSTWNVYCC